MLDEITSLFEQDRREKAKAAQGAKHRASRTGKVGKLRMPADFLGKDYSKSSRPVSFTVEELLRMLQDTPTIKQLLLERLEAEYQNYKLAIQQTVDTVYKITELALYSVQEELQELRQEVQDMKSRLHSLQSYGEARPGRFQQGPALIHGSGRGRSPEQMKEHVFKKIDQMQSLGLNICLENVLNYFPGATYYLYTLKLWQGCQEMFDEYFHARSRIENELGLNRETPGQQPLAEELAN
ncbi:MAG: hypothetical protein ACOY9Y_03270 [Bacillota bacterium]